MNIAEITTYREGGAYTHVAELVKGIKANILIISGNTKKLGYHEEDGLTFFHIPAKLSIWDWYFINSIGSYKKVEKILKKHKIDLVHIHGPLFTFCDGLIRKIKTPRIMTIHYILKFKGNRILTFLYNRFIRWITRYVAKKVDKVICVNEEHIPIFTSWGIERKKIVFIPNGINTEKFSPGKSDIKRKLKCKNMVIFWGRLNYQKNVQTLLKAFNKIKIPNTNLVIIGRGSEEKKLKALANKNENIVFTGYLPDDILLKYARGADIAVLPSRGESWGLVIGEAMACGLPVITSDVGIAKKLIGEDRGIILKKNNEDEMTEKIEYLLINKKLAEEMGKRARKFVKDKYSWDIISKKTGDLYKTVIKQKKNTMQIQE
ncbi:MAG: glycosyltransferase family 4 protein [Thermoplasmatales archaeon]|nr:MAG: glycosyltransferase family 4 protein [Thermoplasmatales archaeon]